MLVFEHSSVATLQHVVLRKRRELLPSLEIYAFPLSIVPFHVEDGQADGGDRQQTTKVG